MKVLATWFQEHGKETKLGSWSDREFWLDVPEVFVDFVVESMASELADYDSVGSIGRP